MYLQVMKLWSSERYQQELFINIMTSFFLSPIPEMAGFIYQEHYPFPNCMKVGRSWTEFRRPDSHFSCAV